MTSRRASRRLRTSAAAPSSTLPAVTRCGRTSRSASASRTSGSTADLTVNASIPDPLFFDRPRNVTTSVADAHHSQTAINLTGTWVMPITDKIDIGYQFGPTIFLVSQDLPGVPTITEPGPTITSLPLASEDKTTVGVHFGVDLTYMVTPRFGVGGIARYSWGSADLAGADDSLTVGGFQIGAGLRVRF